MSDHAQELAEMLPGAGADLMLVTAIVNVRYLTGFTGSNGLVVVGPDRRAFSSDFRYVEQAADEVDPSFERHLARATSSRQSRRCSPSDRRGSVSRPATSR